MRRPEIGASDAAVLHFSSLTTLCPAHAMLQAKPRRQNGGVWNVRRIQLLVGHPEDPESLEHHEFENTKASSPDLYQKRAALQNEIKFLQELSAQWKHDVEVLQEAHQRKLLQPDDSSSSYEALPSPPAHNLRRRSRSAQVRQFGGDQHVDEERRPHEGMLRHIDDQNVQTAEKSSVLDYTC